MLKSGSAAASRAAAAMVETRERQAPLLPPSHAPCLSLAPSSPMPQPSLPCCVAVGRRLIVAIVVTVMHRHSSLRRCHGHGHRLSLLPNATQNVSALQSTLRSLLRNVLRNDGSNVRSYFMTCVSYSTKCKSGAPTELLLDEAVEVRMSTHYEAHYEVLRNVRGRVWGGCITKCITKRITRCTLRNPHYEHLARNEARYEARNRLVCPTLGCPT